MKDTLLQLTNTKQHATTQNNKIIKITNQAQYYNGKAPQTIFKQSSNVPITKKFILEKQFSLMVQKGNIQNKRIQREKNNSQTENHYACNMYKINKLSSKLQELYGHYRKKQDQNENMQNRIDQLPQIKRENAHITVEIEKIRNIIKDILLEREKQRIHKQ